MSEIIPLVPFATTPNEARSYGKLLRQLGLLSKKPTSFFLGSVEKKSEPPQHISIGASMWRVFRCDPTCGVCCKFEMTLDYIPGEYRGDLAEEGFKQLTVIVNEKPFTVWSQMSEANKHGGRCRYVSEYQIGDNRAVGCSRWEKNSPLSCVTAPNIHIQSHGPEMTIISKKPFGRHTMWSVLPRCEFEPYPVEKINAVEVKRDLGLLYRWKNWADYFELDTYLPEIISIFLEVLQGNRAPESIRVV